MPAIDNYQLLEKEELFEKSYTKEENDLSEQEEDQISESERVKLFLADEKRKLTLYCNIVPILGVITILLFFLPLFGLLLGADTNSKNYQNVIVTPFSDIPGDTNNSITTQPCYYPVFKTNLTNTYLCSYSTRKF